ncbi:MAG: restriction endonuclease subunit S [Pseudoxanthomonas suwonensis]|nr:restriction endonuclease subunit S [Pseudoxanthomonas suwonensis]
MTFPSVQLQDLALTQKGAIVSGPFGSSISAKYFVEDGIPVIRGNNLTIGGAKFVDEGFAYLTEEKASEFRNCEALIDDLIFTAAGSIGQVGIIPKDAKYPRYIISNKQLRVRVDSVRANPLFVYYWLTSPVMTKYIISQNNGGAVPLLNLGIIKKLPVPYPSVLVQDRIVAHIAAYDDLIENNRRRAALLEQSARLLYREWFVHLRFPGHEHVKVVDGVPEGWERKPLSSLAEINARSLHGKHDGEIEYIDIASVTTGSINESTAYRFSDAPSRARRVVRHGDIIWSCVRPNRASYAMVWQPIDNLIASTGFCVISPMRLPPTYAYFALSTKDFIGYLTSNAKGAAYPAVVASDFEKYEILVPSTSVLSDFRAATETSFDMIETLKRQNEKLRQARDLLLPRLMSGELAV